MIAAARPPSKFGRMRHAVLKTWVQFERCAGSDRFKRMCARNGVSVYSTDAFPEPLVTIVASNLPDGYADKRELPQ